MSKQYFAQILGRSAEERRIGITAIWVLGLVVLLLTLIMSGGLMRHIYADSRAELNRNLGDYSQRFQEALDAAMEDVAEVAVHRPNLRKILLRRWQGHPRDSDARDMEAILNGVVSRRNIAGISLEDAAGRPIGSQGRFVRDAPISVPIASFADARLSWQDGYVLQATAPVIEQGVGVGRVHIDVRLPGLGQKLAYAELGETGEVVVCAPNGPDRMRCFPHRFRAPGYAGPHMVNGEYLPMHYALEGKSDVIVTRDYRGVKVVDAFAPIGDTGLGMVVKMDEAELYRPLEEGLPWLLAVFAALLGGGTLLMRRQLAPLVRGMLRSRSQVQAVVENAADGIVTIDGKGRIEGFNPAASAMFGYALDEVVGRNVRLLMPEPYHGRHDEYIQRYLRGGCPHVIGLGGREVEALRKDGTRFPLELAVSEMAVEGGRKFIALLRDVTERKRAEEALRESRDRLNRAQAVAHIGSWSLDFGNNALEWSAETYRIFSVSPGTPLTFEAFLACVHPDEREQVERAWQAALKGAPYDIDHRIVVGDEMRWVNELAELEFDTEGKPVRAVGTAQDISERKQAEARINHLAFYDTLTDLPNRALCLDRLQHGISVTSRHGQGLAVMFVDLDMFKRINDSLGHATGDRLLQEAAHRLAACVRASDTVARMGGDEFVVIMNDVTEGTASMLSHKLLGTLRKPFAIDGHALHVTGSIGTALYPRDGTDAQTLLRNADAAMYRAKEQGRDTARFYTEEMNLKALERLALEEDLHQALLRGEFVVHYQPRVDLRSGETTGLEALVRWQHPDKGLIPPDHFIPVVEEMGLILPLSEWVLSEACTQVRAWERAGLRPVSVAVNLSARQFRQAELVENVVGILRDTGLDPRHLELEITESMVVSQVEEAIVTLARLNALGVRLAIDDFGTGYSSLGQLKRFPVHVLKIDKSFVAGIPSDPDDMTIVTTIISMAHGMKLRAVAEGVESETQLAFLRERGCDEMQGYFFSKPVPAQEAESLLREGRCLPQHEADGVA